METTETKEDKKLGDKRNGSVTQLEEYHAFNMGVPGSSPGGVTNFKYCILKYVHSPILGESVNVGIFFQFGNEIFLKHPDDFTRIKGLYNDFSEWQLKENLVSLLDKTKLVNNISDVLRLDATVLKLSKINTAVSWDDQNTTMNAFYELYFK